MNTSYIKNLKNFSSQKSLFLMGIVLIFVDIIFSWFHNWLFLKDFDSSVIIWFFSDTFVYELVLVAILVPLVEELAYRGGLEYTSKVFHRIHLGFVITYAIVLSWFYSIVSEALPHVGSHLILLGAIWGLPIFTTVHYIFALRHQKSFPYSVTIPMTILFFVCSHHSLWFGWGIELFLIRLTVAGLIYTYLTYYLGLRYAILAHMLSNGVVLLYLLERGVYTSIFP